jgi:dTDP-4-amino-4,6-dideoxygalactose transaminase
MEPYRTMQPDAARRLPVTEEVAQRIMVLPTGTSVGHQEIITICKIINDTDRE